MLIIVNYMMVSGRRFNFAFAMRFGLLLFFLFISVGVFAQEKSLDGIIFDKSSKERIAEVNVVNLATGKSIYNNLKGEFLINAEIGDLLIFTKQNYYPDTVKVQSYTSLAVYIKPSAIQLKEVTIHDTTLTPEQQYESIKRQYPNIYGYLDTKDALTTAPGGGVGLSIDAIYNALSRSGRNAAHLRENIEEDYHQSVIDYRFNRTLVSRITGLTDAKLTDFMQKYRPSYYMITTASDYEFISNIRANYRRYLRRPKAYALPPLVK